MRPRRDDSIPTRSSLLSHIKDWDDQESWKTFVDTYWQPVFRIALKAGLTEEEAQDATQETILAIARKISGFKRDPALGSFRAWLFHTARWKITDQFRKRPPGGASSQPGSGDPDATGTTERISDPGGCDLETIWDEEYHHNLIEVALERVKRQVDPKAYQIYDCHVIKQWTVEEVMRTLGVSRHQVYNAKSRISKLLRKTIEQLETQML